MRNSHASVLGMVVIVTAIILSGCTSTRYTSTLKPSGDKVLQYGSMRFNIAGFTYEKPGVEPLPPVIDQKSKELYPSIFTDDWTALPVHVDIRRSLNDTSLQVSYFLTGFCTLGIVPFPGTAENHFTVTTSVLDSLGECLSEKQESFEIDMTQWGSLFPWGLLPVPGVSDLPRDSFVDNNSKDDNSPHAKVNNYAAECIAEAVVRSLKSADQAKLAAAYNERKARVQEITVDGKRCWSFITMTSFSKGKKGDTFTALIYPDYPKRGLKPLDKVVVARSDGSGRWSPVSGYLHHARTLTSVSALMDGGVPARVAVRTIETPPLEDFIDTPDLAAYDSSDVLRWSNSVLLEAKNRSLVKVLQEESGSELLGLATRIEKSILDLNEQAEKAKDRAQAKVEKGEGDPAPDRELSVLCRQRMEILKPILAAVKQQAAVKRQD